MTTEPEHRRPVDQVVEVRVQKRLVSDQPYSIIGSLGAFEVAQKRHEQAPLAAPRPTAVGCARGRDRRPRRSSSPAAARSRRRTGRRRGCRYDAPGATRPWAAGWHAEQRNDADRQVDEEHLAPGPVLQDEAAQVRAEDPADREDAGEEARPARDVRGTGRGPRRRRTASARRRRPPGARAPRSGTRSTDARPHNSEPNVKMPTQIRKTFLRPSESLSLPASGSMITWTSWYAVSVQPT